MADIGLVIRKLRTDKKISSTDLAAKIGVSRNTLYNWEVGEIEPRSSQMEKIAKALDVSVHYLKIQSFDFFPEEGSTVIDYKKENEELRSDNEMLKNVVAEFRAIVKALREEVSGLKLELGKPKPVTKRFRGRQMVIPLHPVTSEVTVGPNQLQMFG